jgi:hypothetical protein
MQFLLVESAESIFLEVGWKNKNNLVHLLRFCWEEMGPTSVFYKVHERLFHQISDSLSRFLARAVFRLWFFGFTDAHLIILPWRKASLNSKHIFPQGYKSDDFKTSNRKWLVLILTLGAIRLIPATAMKGVAWRSKEVWSSRTGTTSPESK